MQLKVTLIIACDLKIVLLNNVAIHTKHDHFVHSRHKLIYFYVIMYHTQYRNHSGFFVNDVRQPQLIRVMMGIRTIEL